MNEPIVVDAIFDTQGKITPQSAKLQDKQTKELFSYNLSIEYSKLENFAGIPTVLFGCFIERNGCRELIKIKYHKLTTQWVLVN